VTFYNWRAGRYEPTWRNTQKIERFLKKHGPEYLKPDQNGPRSKRLLCRLYYRMVSEYESIQP
jgi:hypothetical protein